MRSRLLAVCIACMCSLTIVGLLIDGRSRRAHAAESAAAKKVLRGLRDGELNLVRSIARREEQNDYGVWYVAEELRLTGHRKEAIRFAELAPERVSVPLLRYLQSETAIQMDDPGRALFSKVARLAQRQAWQEIVHSIPESATSGASVLRMRLRRSRAIAQIQSGDQRGGIATWIATADTLVRLGWVEHAATCMEQAALACSGLKEHHRSAQFMEKAYGLLLASSIDRRVEALANLCQFRRLSGSIPAAIEAGELALALARELPALHTLQLSVSRVLGAAYAAFGNHPEAARHLELAALTARASGDMRSLARIVSDLAQSYLSAGRAEAALHLVSEVLSHPDAQGRLGARDLASLQMRTAAANATLGRLRVALAQFELAEKGLREGPPRVGLANLLPALLVNFGNLHNRLGRPRKAARMYKEALTLTPEGSTTWNRAKENLGFLEPAVDDSFDLVSIKDLPTGERGRRALNAGFRLKSADPKMALLCFTVAMRDFKSLEDKEREVRARTQIAVLLANKSKLVGAASQLREARRVSELLGPRPELEFWLLNMEGQVAFGARDWSLATAKCVEALGILEGVAFDLGPGERRHLLESGRHTSEVGATAAARTQDVDAFLRVGQLYRSFRFPGAPTLVSTQPMSSTGSSAIRDQIEGALKHAGRRWPTFSKGEKNQSRRRIERLREKLVESVDRESRSRGLVQAPKLGVASIQQVLAKDEVLVSYAFALGEVHAAVLTRSRAAIVRLGSAKRVEDFIARLRSASRTSASGALADEVRAMLIDPLSLPASARNLLVLPDLGGADVPFGVLSGTHRVSLLLNPPKDRAVAESNPKRVFAVGGASRPEYSTLEHSGPEAKEVGDLALVGASATEERVRRVLNGKETWRAVHFACHAFPNEEPMLSRLILASSDLHDGNLEAWEISGLRVRARLAVLSGCETGAGVRHSGGAAGLVGAFFAAGVNQVVCSLWRVDDDATSALMKEFYLQLGAGQDAPEALWLAQNKIKSNPKWRNEWFWGSWVVWMG